MLTQNIPIHHSVLIKLTNIVNRYVLSMLYLFRGITVSKNIL